jgi:actin related protein 2/3 complex subunit 2
LEVKLADFDQVVYHVWTPSAENKRIVRISLGMKCFSKELKSYGAMEYLKKEYGDLVVSDAEDGYDVTLEFDEDKISAEQRSSFIQKICLLKCNSMAAPFERAFDEQTQGKIGNLMFLHYRDEESMFIKAANDRVTVIFSTLFKEETDRIFAKVFLQEFVDSRKQPGLQNAPQVLYSNKEPPMEIRGVEGLKEGDNVGYITFVLFPRHYCTPEKRVATIQLIQYFRDYLHYHIKCSKAYMHSRMRAKVESWTKVLNRARPEIEKEKKTAAGKTFVRK